MSTKLVVVESSLPDVRGVLGDSSMAMGMARCFSEELIAAMSIAKAYVGNSDMVDHNVASYVPPEIASKEAAKRCTNLVLWNPKMTECTAKMVREAKFTPTKPADVSMTA